ncbi:acyltransferase family protein [Paenibacillus solisilvae]|uniref:Acyltransferase family protein n=1 Tax=Paenibacillus solisilvae TaxID=2486751 RepID=A0ABW0W0B5_9BACL
MLSDLMQGRKNNLDFVRLIAAVAVVFSHCFHLTTGDFTIEPVYVFSHGQTSLGSIAVIIFFVTSGFLISRSFERTPDLWSYIKARSLRIFPGLTLSVLFCMFVVGPIATNFHIIDYLSDKSTYIYLSRATTFAPDLNLPGVFSDNIYPDAVNSSLWTLKYELLCYIFVAIAGVLRLINKRIMISLLILNLVYHMLPGTEVLGKYINDMARFSLSFFVGMLYYLYRSKIPQNIYLFVASLLSCVASLQFGFFNEIFPIIGGYAIFYFALTPGIKLHGISKFGDLSYGVYIFAFPVQQLVTYFMKNDLIPIQNFLISLPLILILSFISWHLVERPFLRMKPSRKLTGPELTVVKSTGSF